MEQIADLVKQSAHGAKGSASACNDLSGLAADLKDLISRFKLGDVTANSPRASASTLALQVNNRRTDSYRSSQTIM